MDSPREQHRAQRRLRFRRRGKRAYIRSVYFLPSLATLGNAVCGFAAIYIVMMDPATVGTDPVTRLMAENRFLSASYLILLSMVFDALDGRLARWARHTTDFGGQLDSLADVVSFGVAPAMVVLALVKHELSPETPLFLSRMIWAIGALYMSCAAIRLARFNTSNEHGEQHHMSFLGLPSPGAAAAVIGLVMIHREITNHAIASTSRLLDILQQSVTVLLPILLLACGLLMVSNLRYSHLVNRYLRGRQSIARLVFALLLVGLLITAHRYTIGVGCILYALSAPAMHGWIKYVKKSRGVRA